MEKFKVEIIKKMKAYVVDRFDEDLWHEIVFEKDKQHNVNILIDLAISVSVYLGFIGYKTKEYKSMYYVSNILNNNLDEFKKLNEYVIKEQEIVHDFLSKSTVRSFELFRPTSVRGNIEAFGYCIICKNIGSYVFILLKLRISKMFPRQLSYSVLQVIWNFVYGMDQIC